jgi:hypothetical protein
MGKHWHSCRVMRAEVCVGVCETRLICGQGGGFISSPSLQTRRTRCTVLNLLEMTDCVFGDVSKSDLD